MQNIHRRAQLFISIGVLGIASYQLIMRFLHPAFLASDFIHGIWFGVFLGLEIYGLYLFRKSRRQPSA